VRCILRVSLYLLQKLVNQVSSQKLAWVREACQLFTRTNIFCHGYLITKNLPFTPDQAKNDKKRIKKSSHVKETVLRSQRTSQSFKLANVTCQGQFITENLFIYYILASKTCKRRLAKEKILVCCVCQGRLSIVYTNRYTLSRITCKTNLFWEKSRYPRWHMTSCQESTTLILRHVASSSVQNMHKKGLHLTYRIHCLSARSKH